MDDCAIYWRWERWQKNTKERIEDLFFRHVKFERSIIYLSRDKRAMEYICLDFKENIGTEDTSIIHVICNSYFYSYVPNNVPDTAGKVFS